MSDLLTEDAMRVAREVQGASSMHRDHLAQAVGSLVALVYRPRSDRRLASFEAEALLKELERLANIAALHGSPTPADMAGIDENGHDLVCDGTSTCRARKHLRCPWEKP